MFRAIAADNFPPFRELLLKIPPVEDKPDELAEVHLFTGVNGTGKTRLLSVLSAFLGQSGSLTKRLKGVESTLTLRASDQFSVSDQNNAWPGMVHTSAKEFRWLNHSPFYQWTETKNPVSP